MEMRKCARGHYYDASIHTECPYCNREGTGMVSGERTMPLGVPAADGGERTMPLASGGDTNVTRPIFEAVQTADDDEGRTVALIQKEMGIDPVVGWLICVAGKEKGRDYRIHSDNNYIGRSEKMDICIRGDETISRENQAVITYDVNDNGYFFSPGDGRSIVRINNKAIFQTVELKAYDRIMIGKTEFIFVPLCGENFAWERE